MEIHRKIMRGMLNVVDRMLPASRADLIDSNISQNVTVLDDSKIGIVDASRIPTSPSRNDAQG
eukprot:691744-Pyramimonas_sp.AAC.1